MLTATYTLVALSVEQTNVRMSLQSLQQLMESNFMHQSALTAGQVSYACDAVQRLCDCPHWRKLDKFLIPAIRNASLHANDVLQALEELARASAAAMGDVAIRLGAGAVDTAARVGEFCRAIETFVTATLQRLELEDKHLFPLARAVISGETWFSIANQMMAHDAYVQDCRPVRALVRPSRVTREHADAPARSSATAHLVH